MKPFLAKWKCKYRLAVDAVGFVDLVNPITDLKPIGIKGSDEIKTTMDIFTHGQFNHEKKNSIFFKAHTLQTGRQFRVLT